MRFTGFPELAGLPILFFMIQIPSFSLRTSMWGLLLLAPLLVNSAHARGAPTDVDDPSLNALGRNINRVLEILRTNHNAASPRCLAALEDMHKAEHEMDRIHNHNDPDLGLARDVLGSSMEESLRACGTDAAELCAHSSSNTAQLSEACQKLPEIPGEDPSLDLGQSGASVL